MKKTRASWFAAVVFVAVIMTGCDGGPQMLTTSGNELDDRLTAVLAEHGFSGRIESSLEAQLGRRVNRELARIGQLLFFDPVTSLAVDGKNTCAGCHAPNVSFGDTQSIAIGVNSNGIVGPNRAGPRNMRRSPTVINAAFYPRLMLNSRFESLSGSPFDSSQGFLFPEPEGLSLSHLPHLFAAQAFLPVVDRAEMAGFHFEGSRDEMRAALARRVDAIGEYRERFGEVFPEIKAGAPLAFEHLGLAIAEFQLSLVFANAPIDRYARGQLNALSEEQKRGALLFFGKAQCVACHAVDVPFASGDEMFSDFREHVLGVPQIVPEETNVGFDGPAQDQDFGREHVSGDPADRYKFRTSPLRNVGLQATFMHNGAFLNLEDAIRHHLDAYRSARNYSPAQLDADLQQLGPVEPVLERLDPLIQHPPKLNDAEFGWLVDFVRHGLTDPRARPERLRRFVPGRVPSAQPLHHFEFE